MIQFVGNVNDIPLYEDTYMEDNDILYGNQDGVGHTFMIASPKTSNIIYSQSKEFKKKVRKEKLNKLNET